MNLKTEIRRGIRKFLVTEYNWAGEAEELEIELTRKGFEGEFTFVVFPFLRFAKTTPELLAEAIGDSLKTNLDFIKDFNIVKGFLNLSINSTGWLSFMREQKKESRKVRVEKPEKILVEFCSPNTNKPLHLGHIRNILLGDSLSRILKAVGHDVINTQVVNDRGIAICKSMLAWMRWGNGETPESTGIKGDHFVGKYYVLFDRKLTEEYINWQEDIAAEEMYNHKMTAEEKREEFFKRYKNDYFNEHSVLGKEARDLLLRWENGDPETRKVWARMNSWVMEGFEETFRSLNVNFDKNYFESDTYVLGRDVVEKGEKEGLFSRRPDGSIWVDLSEKELGEKILLRADGTSLYMTQDIGTAELRYADYKMDRMIYVVGNEQEYHFQALFAILEKIGVPYADGLYHLSYGMVDLPSGKMKSREGNVVDADDLIHEVYEAVIENTEERGELGTLSEDEFHATIQKIAMAALKFFIIQVNPRRRMLYDPKQSVDLQGHTGPYVQNAYVRIKSLLRKHTGELKSTEDNAVSEISLNTHECKLLLELHETNEKIMLAAEEYNPSLIAEHAYAIAKAYHRFYHEVPILRAENAEKKRFRLNLSQVTASHLEYLFDLLNIKMPDRM